MSGLTLFGITILKNRTEREICNSFDRYEKALADQKLELYDEIAKWEDLLIHKITEHVNQQKSLLEKEFANRIDYLNKTRREFVEALHVHKQTNNTQEINQLFDRCNALKFKMASLKFESQPISFVQAIKEESVVMKRSKSDAGETESNKFDNKSIVKDNNSTDDNHSAYSESFSKTTSTNTKQTNRQLSVIEISNDDDRSAICHNDMIEECCTCFMAFPSNMVPGDRLAHVNGHFTNNSANYSTKS